MATRIRRPPRPWNLEFLNFLGERGGAKSKYLKAVPVLILEKWVRKEREEDVANRVSSMEMGRRLQESGLKRSFEPKGIAVVLAALVRIQNAHNLTNPRLIEYRKEDEDFWINLPEYEALLQDYRRDYQKRRPEDYEKLFPEGEPEWEQKSKPDSKVTKVQPDVQSQSLYKKILQVVQEYKETWEKRVQDADNRAGALEQEKGELIEKLRERSSALDEVTDAELKERIAPLFGSNRPFDTILREASAVFETRLRTVGGCDNTLAGKDLVEALFHMPKPILKFSSHPGEQDGVSMLYRGAMQFIRNPPMHGLKEYPEDTVRLFIRLIDSLLLLLTKAEPRRVE